MGIDKLDELIYALPEFFQLPVEDVGAIDVDDIFRHARSQLLEGLMFWYVRHYSSFCWTSTAIVVWGGAPVSHKQCASLSYFYGT